MTTRRARPVTKRLTRRELVAMLGAAVPLAGATAWGQPSRNLLPVDTPKLDHLDVVVPDVAASARFYMDVFDTSLHAQPFQGGYRYFVLLGDLPESREVGYIAIGDSGGRGARIGHFCTSVFDYRANAATIDAAMTQVFAAAGFGALPARRGFGGIFTDPDGIEIQFLPAPDTLVTAAVPSDLVEPHRGLVRPLGLDHVLLRVSDLNRAVEFYRILYGPEAEREAARVWFRIGETRLGLEPTRYRFGDTPRIEHFCVAVEPFDRSAVISGLTALGAQALPAPDERDVLRLRDPDGIVLELKMTSFRDFRPARGR